MPSKYKKPDSVNIERLAPNPEELAELYRQAGWTNQADLQDLQRPINASSCWFQARVERKLAGFLYSSGLVFSLSVISTQ